MWFVVGHGLKTVFTPPTLKCTKLKTSPNRYSFLRTVSVQHYVISGVLTKLTLKRDQSRLRFVISVAILVGLVLTLVSPFTQPTSEILARTQPTILDLMVALASGAAASLSLVSGTSSVLVGVMVAVALMPPAVTIGLMLSIADFNHALGAALLLAVNIVCINLSSKLVFLFRGIQPRNWLEARKAKQSRLLYIMIWVVTLLLLIVMIYLRHRTQA